MSLPPIFHYWSSKFLVTKFRDKGVDFCCNTEMYRHYIEKFENPSVLTLGTTLEDNFDIKLIKDKKYDIIILDYCLSNDDVDFDELKKHLQKDGYILINDYIGKKGFLREERSLDIIQNIWDNLDRDKKFNHIMGKELEYFYDYDHVYFSKSEGINDFILDMDEEFSISWGGIIEVFIDREYGFNFDIESKQDKYFIDMLYYLNELEIKSGKINPTYLIGAYKLGKKRRKSEGKEGKEGEKGKEGKEGEKGKEGKEGEKGKEGKRN